MHHVTISNSSNIASIGYDGTTQVLEVRFNNGKTYKYEKVPVVLHIQLMNARSKGHYFSKNVRNNPAFPCTEVLDWKPEVIEQAEKRVQRHVALPNNVGGAVVDLKGGKNGVS